MGTHTVHFDIVVRRHVCFDNHNEGPKSVFFVFKNFNETEYEEIEALDVSNCRVTPNVSLNDSTDLRLNVICVVRITGECSTYVSLVLLKHLVGVL